MPLPVVVIVELHVFRLVAFLSVDVYDAVDDLQLVARHADETLDVVLAFIHRMGDDLAKVGVVVPHPFPAVFTD